MSQLTGQNITFPYKIKKPLLSHFLHEKRYSIILLVTVVTHLSLSYFHLISWECPSQAIHLNCPGCGLTRATLLLITGRPIAALHQHLFCPIPIIFALILLTNIILPFRMRQQFLHHVRQLELRTGFTYILITLWAGYWIINLFI